MLLFALSIGTTTKLSWKLSIIFLIIQILNYVLDDPMFKYL